MALKSAERYLVCVVEAWSRPTDARRHHPLIMVRVDTHVVVLQVEGILAEFDMLEFIFVEVRPAP